MSKPKYNLYLLDINISGLHHFSRCIVFLALLLWKVMKWKVINFTTILVILASCDSTQIYVDLIITIIKATCINYISN